MLGYTGFSYGGIHSSTFKIVRVCTDTPYEDSPYMPLTNESIEPPEMVGAHWMGVKLHPRVFTMQIFFNGLSESEFADLSDWLHPKKTKELIFDEAPYKYYNATINDTPIFSFTPFFIKSKFGETPTLERERTGSAMLSFVAYDPLAYSTGESYNTQTGIPVWAKASGQIPTDFVTSKIILPFEQRTLPNGTVFPIYNGGNADAIATFTFETFPFQDELEIRCLERKNDVIRIQAIDRILKVDTPLLDRTIVLWSFSIEKRQAFAVGLNSTRQPITEKTNIGAAHNHYFPKIYAGKPMQVLQVDQTSPNNVYEPFISPVRRTEVTNCQPSNHSASQGVFEPFKSTVAPSYGCSDVISFFVNTWISDFRAMTADLGNKPTERLGKNKTCCFVTPCKFLSNKTLLNFSAGFKFTYY